MKTTHMAVALLVLFASQALADDEEKETPTAVFQGYDTFSGAFKHSLVKGDVNDSDAKVVSKISLCDTLSEVHDALGIEASAEGSYGMGSASAKASFASSLDISEKSVVLVVYVSKRTTQKAKDPDFTDEVTAEHLRDAFKRYGDSWVKEITTGSEYYATFTMTASTIDDKQKLALELSGAVGECKASASATIETAKKNTKNETRAAQRLFGITTAALPELETAAIITFGESLSAIKPDAPTLISARTEGYEKMWPVALNAAVKPMVANRNLFQKASRASNDDTTATGGWESKLQTLEAADAMVTKIQNAYRTYNYTGDPKPDARSGLIKKDIERLVTFLATVSENPLKTPHHIKLKSLSYGVPHLTFQLNEVDLMSDFKDGSPYFSRDVTRPDIIDCQRISGITMSDGGYLYALWFDYEKDGKPTTVRHGGGGHAIVEKPGGFLSLNLAEGEFISGVTGLGGWCRDTRSHLMVRASFETNQGHKLQHRQGSDGEPLDIDRVDFGNGSWRDSTMTWTAKENERLVGFGGRSGNEVNSLRGIVLSLSPAKWTGALRDAAASGENTAAGPENHHAGAAPKSHRTGVALRKYAIEEGGLFEQTSKTKWLLTKKNGDKHQLVEVKSGKGGWIELHDTDRKKTFGLPVRGGKLYELKDGDKEWIRMPFNIKRK